MISSTNIHDVVSVSTRRATRPRSDGSLFHWIEFSIRTTDGSRIEITTFSDELMEIEESSDES